MFDLSSVNKRYFDIRLTVTDDAGAEQSLRLNVEPCKLKTLKSLLALSKTKGEDVIDKLQDAIHKLLSKNREHKEVPAEYIEALDIDELQAILIAYFEWLGDTKTTDPNS